MTWNVRYMFQIQLLREKLCKNETIHFHSFIFIHELLPGLPNELQSYFIKRVICIETQMSHLCFENNELKAKEILYIVHTDMNRPHPMTGNIVYYILRCSK